MWYYFNSILWWNLILCLILLYFSLFLVKLSWQYITSRVVYIKGKAPWGGTFTEISTSKGYVATPPSLVSSITTRFSSSWYLTLRAIYSVSCFLTVSTNSFTYCVNWLTCNVRLETSFFTSCRSVLEAVASNPTLTVRRSSSSFSSKYSFVSSLIVVSV